MAKARSRTAVRKIKDRWKAKTWYNVVAPPSFDNVTVADALADSPHSLINRVTEISLQDLTNDFRKSHIKLYFKIHEVEETNAHTQFVGHTLTSDYLRRMIRRRRSKIDGVYDAITRDGATIRVKPFATTDKRMQKSQKKTVREAMKKTLYDQAKTSTLAEFVKNILDGKTGSEIYKSCRKLYPVKRVEIYKTEVLSPPTVKVEEKKTAKKEEAEEIKEVEKKEKKTTKKAEKKEVVEEKPKEEPKEEKKPAAKETTEKPKKKEKPKAKKSPKKTAKKSTKTTTEKKATTKKKTTKKEKK
jgi:small subunit ribosomal protein S3Ae